MNNPFPRQYAAQRLIIHKGRGNHLIDNTGKAYLDFGSGIAVNALGYRTSTLARIAKRQMRTLIHSSNLYLTQPGIDLARELLHMSSGEFSAVHFANSGTEAIESAMKYARLYAYHQHKDKHRILSFHNCFHGRTMGALSLNAQKKYRQSFEPLLPGCVSIPFNDTKALNTTLNTSFAAVITEVIQGEGGMESMKEGFARELRKLCNQHDLLLVVDEIQTGLGRTGSFLASSHFNLQPDILTLSKPLAGGLPLAATLIPEKVNRLLKTGDHGTTFGGGPVTCAVAREVLRRIRQPSLRTHVHRVSQVLEDQLQSILHASKDVEELRGKGLLRGLLIGSTRIRNQIIERAQKNGLLLLPSGERTLRLAPPLTIKTTELMKGIDIIRRILFNLT